MSDSKHHTVRDNLKLLLTALKIPVEHQNEILAFADSMVWHGIREETQSLQGRLNETIRLMIAGEDLRHRKMLESITGQFPPKP